MYYITYKQMILNIILHIAILIGIILIHFFYSEFSTIFIVMMMIFYISMCIFYIQIFKKSKNNE